MDLAWMAWTWQTGLFFIGIASGLALMTTLALLRPETERVGVLGIPTTRGDRFFLSLLSAAFIHLGWLALVPLDLVWGSAVALLWSAFVFRFV